MKDRNDEKAVAVIRNTCQGTVPRQEGGHESKQTASCEDWRVRLSMGIAMEVSNPKQQECHIYT